MSHISLFQRLVQSRLWIAWGALSLAFASYVVSGTPTNPWVLGLAFLGTWIGYALQPWLGKQEIKLTKPWVHCSQAAWVALFVMIGVYYGNAKTLNIYLWMMVFGIPVFLYPVTFRTQNKRIGGIRAVPFVKIWVVALSWTFVSVLGFVEGEVLLTPQGKAYASMMFLYLVGLILPFDMRDMLTDSHRLRTVAQLVGWRKAKIIACLCLACSALIAFFYMDGLFMWVASFINAITLGLIVRCPKHASEIYYEGLLDGTLILWGLAALVV